MSIGSASDVAPPETDSPNPNEQAPTPALTTWLIVAVRVSGAPWPGVVELAAGDAGNVQKVFDESNLDPRIALETGQCTFCHDRIVLVQPQ